MPRRSASVELAVEESEQLERWIRAGATPQQVVLRAKIVRQAADGSTDKQIAADLSIHPRTVALGGAACATRAFGKSQLDVDANRALARRRFRTGSSAHCKRSRSAQPTGALARWAGPLELARTRFTGLGRIISSSRT